MSIGVATTARALDLAPGTAQRSQSGSRWILQLFAEFLPAPLVDGLALLAASCGALAGRSYFVVRAGSSADAISAALGPRLN